MNKWIVLLILSVVTLGSLQAQSKYGHLNYGNLLASLPETEVADKELEAFRAQLVKKGETMAQAFQEDYGKFVNEVQSGSLSPIQQQQRQAQLQEEQQKIVAYEQQIRQQVQAKREEVLSPILEKVEQAIQEVGKENGYMMIFDTSTFNAILFAEESEDVMGMVKAKLGIE